MTYRPEIDPQVPPLQWVGGWQTPHLLTAPFEHLPVQERQYLIDRIEQKQDQYQTWLSKLPPKSLPAEQVKQILIDLKNRRLQIFLSIRPAFADKIKRASQTPCP